MPKAAMTTRQYCLQEAVDRNLFLEDVKKIVFFLFEDENTSCVRWCYPPNFVKKFNTVPS